jgi:mannan endo-1,4-beta-mannosidase
MHRILFFLILFSISACKGFSQKFEAESATLGGATKIENPTASGGYFVAQNAGILSFTVTLETASAYTIYIQVSSSSENAVDNISVDGTSTSFSVRKDTAFFHQKVIENMKLSAGQHKIVISKAWGSINIDFIEFEKVDTSNKTAINETLVTPNPTNEAERLYQFLYDNYGEKIISGVMTLGSMDEVGWLKTNTGKEPALVGLDFMHCNRGYGWYNNLEPVNDAQKYYNRNGIPALCWHWRDPSRKTESFYTKDTSFDISKIFDENSSEYTAMISDIDYTAGLLKKLQDNKIAVLWRPLHEAAGGWFWWGAKGAAPCKKLWQIMFERMVNYHGLQNLIWVWTREPNDDAWYPGDEYVDMVGRDIYKTGDHGSQISEFNSMMARYGLKKMVTISECGSFPDPDNLVKDGTAWSYFMPWYGDFVRDSKYNSLELWKKALASDYVITLDEMPNLRTYTSPDSTTLSRTRKTSNIKVYPTFFKDYIRVESDHLIHSVSVYNQLGVKIREVEPENTIANIYLADIPPGIYLLKAENEVAVKIFKQ